MFIAIIFSWVTRGICGLTYHVSVIHLFNKYLCKALNCPQYIFVLVVSVDDIFHLHQSQRMTSSRVQSQFGWGQILLIQWVLAFVVFIGYGYRDPLFIIDNTYAEEMVSIKYTTNRELLFV